MDDYRRFRSHIYQAGDKSNLSLNRRLMGKFRRALDECELMEITLQNRRYTWSTEREKPTLVRLDGAFCTSERLDRTDPWVTQFENKLRKYFKIRWAALRSVYFFFRKGSTGVVL